MSARIPFDDQIYQRAEISDIKLSLIRSHLAEVGSDLLNQTNSLSHEELCRKILMFNDDPTKYFPCAKIDVVEFKNGVGDKFTEKIFKGPIQQQLKDVLVYLKNLVSVEVVKKIPGQAKSIRYYSYPFEAIEEALVNNIFHRGYQDDSPIEIRIYPDKIQMLSFPGPLPPLNKEKLRTKNIVARKYRNRRVGAIIQGTKVGTKLKVQM